VAAPTDILVFAEHPEVLFANNKFLRVPVILQYEDTPLIEVTQEVRQAFTTKVPIYHSDGTLLAVAKGARLHPTDEGKKAGVVLRHPDRKVVCELNGKTLFEMERATAAALAIEAELNTPDGHFVRVRGEAPAALFKVSGQGLDLPAHGNARLTGGIFVGVDIGLRLRKDGSVEIGAKGGKPGFRFPQDVPTKS
jgi:hypothetical protein